jgi:hypothetical protein
LKDFGVDLLERPDSSLKPFKKDRWLIRRNWKMLFWVSAMVYWGCANDISSQDGDDVSKSPDGSLRPF